MRLRVNEWKLDEEKMRQILELIDAGVLVNVDKEIAAGLTPRVTDKLAPDAAEWKFQEDVPEPEAPKKRGPARTAWTLAEERQLNEMRNSGMKYREIAEKLGKGINAIGPRVFYMKQSGEWNAEKKVGMRKGGMSAAHKAAILEGIKRYQERRRNEGVEVRSKSNNNFTEPIRKYIVKSRVPGVSFPSLTERVNKKFDTKFLVEELREVYRKLTGKEVSGGRGRPLSEEHKRAIRQGIRVRKA